MTLFFFVVIIAIVALLAIGRWGYARQEARATIGVEFVIAANSREVADVLHQLALGKGASGFMRAFKLVQIQPNRSEKNGQFTIGFGTRFGDAGTIEIVPEGVQSRVTATTDRLYVGMKGGTENAMGSNFAKGLVVKWMEPKPYAKRMIRFQNGLEALIHRSLAKQH